MDPVLISNKVFQNIQPASNKGPASGTVLYANKYAGVPPVSMPEDLKYIFNNDIGSVGNNVLVQLNKKVESLPDGPWYVDTRDNVIYIHNNRFQEDAAFTYVYQQENSELLSISFETQYITRRASGNINIGLDSDKGLSITALNGDSKKQVDYLDFISNDIAKMKRGAVLACNAYLNNKLPYEQLNLVSQRMKSRGLSWDPSLKEAIQQKYREDKRKTIQDSHNRLAKAYEQYQAAGGPMYKEGRRVTMGSSEMLNQSFSRNLREVDEESLHAEVSRIIIQAAGGNPQTIRTYRDGIERAQRNGTLEQFLKNHFMGWHTLVHEDESGINPVAPFTYELLEVDARSYCPATDEKRIAREAASLSPKQAQEYRDSRQANAGYEYLNNNRGDILIVSSDPFGKVTDINGNTTNTYKIRIFRKTYSIKAKAKQWQIMLAYYNRRGISNKGLTPEEISRRIHEQLNAQNKKVTQKRLTCKMLCVGNPLLESSQVLNIQNVGQRWSGAWRVQSVIHQLTPGEGYTCSLELYQNKYKESGEVTNFYYNSSKTFEGKDKNGNTVYNFTDAESAYYYYLIRNGRVREADDLFMKALKARAINPTYYNQYGVVNMVPNKTSSTGQGSEIEYQVTKDKRLKITDKDRNKYKGKASAARKVYQSKLKNYQSKLKQ
jgi:hypothetical protein